MKLLILGGSGLLGHELWRHFQARHETWVTLRRPAAEYARYGLFEPGRVCEGVEAADFASLERIIARVRPDVVVNCVGIIKQLKEAKCPIPSITLNSLLPHRLAEICRGTDARLVLFSTDCVFSGRKGFYREADFADADDLYGRTKYLGEVADQEHVITLRSSIIGRELGTSHSLLDWFLAQRGRTVRGFRRAIYSGFTTIEMARIVEHALVHTPRLHGLWQVASAPISKHDLLQLVREKFQVKIGIEPYDDFHCDRSLDGSRFNAVVGYTPPEWSEMIDELAARELTQTL